MAKWEEWQVTYAGRAGAGGPVEVRRNGRSVGSDAMRRITRAWWADPRWNSVVDGYRQHRAVMRRLHRTYPARWRRG